jgi:hypothetical protein
MVALIISLPLCSCVQWSYDKQGKPKGTAFAAKASKMVHTEQGFYAEGLDTQAGWKDLMDFGGTAIGTVVGGSVVKHVSDNSIAGDLASTKAGTDKVKATEGTKRLSIKESAATERAKIHAETPITQ